MGGERAAAIIEQHRLGLIERVCGDEIEVAVAVQVTKRDAHVRHSGVDDGCRRVHREYPASVVEPDRVRHAAGVGHDHIQIPVAIEVTEREVRGKDRERVAELRRRMGCNDARAAVHPDGDAFVGEYISNEHIEITVSIQIA